MWALRDRAGVAESEKIELGGVEWLDQQKLTQGFIVGVWVIEWGGNYPHDHHINSIAEKGENCPKVIPPKSSRVISKPKSKRG